ncbi:AfsR/SARP family transcriptional regulator [Streptomyces clavuligerus]|uniref:Transcriptional regulator, SARP family n=1 Tax=Streptomyces clavuligerus TaxID=1901 RepID=B5GMS6_STRCL|nr:BTAD domain-containing putative transcriptional regulator [Streptomyces clavuligerus]ANW22465.1 hypothetical protein BB341_29555 [Streptomyces clavuligerus]AXU17369.1 hypothetical protein D1794_32680 [Streptomyces clavuligerus]EDY47622.1 hypothetical protein SSCG_00650 [Streptomyces clavuligerus]EFG04578.1 Transcriptional regulator, SARP family [Streptomyces clavuligerus]MBY6306974.1 hypothetical protein [Streptomyces clavuligerus]
MRLLLLGPSELRGDDGAAVSLGGARRKAVLAALALSLNRVVPVERLLDLVWDEAPPPSAKAALQGHVASLRNRFDGSLQLVTRPPGYALLADQHAVDVHRMRGLVAASRDATDHRSIRLLESALALWRGPALEDCRSEALRTGAGARLEQTRLCALELLAERLLRTGQGTVAVPRRSTAVSRRRCANGWPRPGGRAARRTGDIRPRAHRRHGIRRRPVGKGPVSVGGRSVGGQRTGGGPPTARPQSFSSHSRSVVVQPTPSGPSADVQRSFRGCPRGRSAAGVRRSSA